MQIWIYEQINICIEGRIIVSIYLEFFVICQQQQQQQQKLVNNHSFFIYLYVRLFICHEWQGFDEYMNLVLDDAYHVKKTTRTNLG